MKLIVLALFAVGIGCSWASLCPPGCGDSFIQVTNSIRPALNLEGQLIINTFDEGIRELKILLARGNIQGLSANLLNIGSGGLNALASTTADRCLEQVFILLAEVDAYAAYQLQFIQSPIEAANIVCNLLNYKAQRINSCNYCGLL